MSAARRLQEKERKQKEREMAFNRLEAFIFDVQEKLGSDDVEKVSTGHIFYLPQEGV